MPLSDKLQLALSDPSYPADQMAELLEDDGITSRDASTLDTPLILAARYNNLTAIEYILNQCKQSYDPTSILNATNNSGESALGSALEANHIGIALRLFQQGADPTEGVNPNNLSENSMRLFQCLMYYHHHKNNDELNESELHDRSICEYEIGHYFHDELNDTEEAVKWFQMSANDGNEQGMINLASYYHDIGNSEQSIQWFKRCLPFLTDQNQHDAVFNHLNALAESDHDDSSAYFANMALGSLQAKQGKLSEALHYFQLAEEKYQSLGTSTPEYDSFFNAINMWNGPSSIKNISITDCLDQAKRYHLLVTSNTEEANEFLIAASSVKSKILHVIVRQLRNDLPEFDEHAYQPYIEALSFFYGWNGKTSNLLRGASLLKKLVQNDKDDLTAYFGYSLIACAYFQQTNEHDLYYPEAFKALNKAHESLGNIESPYRHECVKIILEGSTYVE